MDRTLILAAVALGVAAAYYARPGETVVDGESDAAPDIEDYGQQVIAMADGYTDEVDPVYKNMNQAAFLAAIRPGEGTSGPDGYRTLFGGALFDSYATHPALAGWPGVRLPDGMCAAAGHGPGCVSTAAGAYQINKPTWGRIAAKQGLTDFSPDSQDAAAWALIVEKGADADVLAGRTVAAVNKIRKIWASLPGAGYGQPEVAMASFNTVYQQAGGTLA